MKKGLRLFGHPAHAMLSDVPITLLSTSLLWDAAGWWRHEAFWWTAAFWSIAVGLLAGGTAAVAGFIDYVAIPEGDPALTTGLRHMMAMGVAMGIYIADLVVR